MSESQTSLPPDARPVPGTAEGLSVRDLGDELMVYDRGSDQVHVLNGTARDLYLLADGSRTVAAIVASFLDRHEVASDEGERDALQALTRLLELGLLRLG